MQALEVGKKKKVLQHEPPQAQTAAQKHRMSMTCTAAERMKFLGIAQKLAEKLLSSLLLHVT